MNAHVLPDGSVSRWSGGLPLSYDGWMVPIEDDPLPEITTDEEIRPGALEVVWEGGIPARVIQRWERHPKPAPVLVPATRMTIKRRVSSQEWAGIKAVIAQLAASEDPANQAIAEDWDMATEIDPNDPQTAAVISNLVALGILVTPLPTIFAPPA